MWKLLETHLNGQRVGMMFYSNRCTTGDKQLTKLLPGLNVQTGINLPVHRTSNDTTKIVTCVLSFNPDVYLYAEK